MVVAFSLVVIGVIFYEYIGLVFNKDEKVLTIFDGMFFMVLLCLPINALAFTYDSIFKGLGEMAYLRNVLVGATFIGFVPVLYFSKFMEWHLAGIWAALVIWVLYRAVALIIKFNKKYAVLAE